MACKKLFELKGWLVCSEDSTRDTPLQCKNCKNYEESDSEVIIELVYRSPDKHLDYQGHKKRFTMPNMWGARKCIQRNMQEYLKPRVFQGRESFNVAYLSQINIYSKIRDNLIPCRVDILADGMVEICNEDGELL